MRCPRTALALTAATLMVAGAGPMTEQAQAQLFGKRGTPAASTAPTPPPSDYNAMLGSRGARKLMRNGLDYLNTYQDPERALAYFKEARARISELDAKEQAQLTEAIARANQLVAARVTPPPSAAPAADAALTLASATVPARGSGTAPAQAQGPAVAPSRAVPPMFHAAPSVRRSERSAADPAAALSAPPAAVAAEVTATDAAPLPPPIEPLEATPAAMPLPNAPGLPADAAPALPTAPIAAAAPPVPTDAVPAALPVPTDAVPAAVPTPNDAPAPLPAPADAVLQAKAETTAPAPAPAPAPAADDEAPAQLTILSDPADHLDGLGASAPVAPPLGAPAVPAPARPAAPIPADEPTPAPTAPAGDGLLLMPPAPRVAAAPAAEALPALPTDDAAPAAPEALPTRIAAEPAPAAVVDPVPVPVELPAAAPVAELPTLPAAAPVAGLPTLPTAAPAPPAAAPAPRMAAATPGIDLSRALNSPTTAAGAAGVEPPLPPAADELPTLPGRPLMAARDGQPQPPVGALRPESIREVEEIALRQEADQRANPRIYDSSSRTGRGANEPNPAGGRADVPRAPSPTEARPIKPIPVPEEFVPLERRVFNPTRKYWAAPGNCHMPLYFQDAVLERYGQSVEQAMGPAGRFASYPLDDPKESSARMQLLQPFYSAGMFALQIAALPYNILMDPPWEEQYDLGYHRPGDPIPPDTYYLPRTGLGPALRGNKY